MFVVFGLLSIAGGIVLYRNASVYSAISIIFLYQQGITIAGAAVMIAIGMCVAGLLSCFSKDGEKKWVLVIAALFYLLPAGLTILMRFSDLALWSAICIIFGVLYLLWAIINSKRIHK